MSDPAFVAAAFDRVLRAYGVRAGTRRARTFAEVLALLPPADPPGLYARARASMLPSIDEAPAFDRAFAAAFGRGEGLESVVDRVEGAPSRPLLPPRRETLPPPPSERSAPPAEAERAPAFLLAASFEERLAERGFDELDAHEHAAMLRLIARVRIAGEERRSRRRRPDARGDRFDLAQTLRAAVRTGGEPLRRRGTSATTTLRPIVFLLDVSGSMRPFARALLQYARVTAKARPRVRAFAFATGLTDLGPLLARAPDAALFAALAETVRDFGGGTRIGAALRTFNDRFAQRGAARGGTVVILSDGWERDDPELLRSEMARLRRLTRRIVWVNPHKRHPAYEPLARGMAAAVPYLDAFVSGHSLRTLDLVAAAIEGKTA